MKKKAFQVGLEVIAQFVELSLERLTHLFLAGPLTKVDLPQRKAILQKDLLNLGLAGVGDFRQSGLDLGVHEVKPVEQHQQSIPIAANLSLSRFHTAHQLFDTIQQFDRQIGIFGRQPGRFQLPQCRTGLVEFNGPGAETPLPVRQRGSQALPLVLQIPQFVPRGSLCQLQPNRRHILSNHLQQGVQSGHDVRGRRRLIQIGFDVLQLVATRFNRGGNIGETIGRRSWVQIWQDRGRRRVDVWAGAGARDGCRCGLSLPATHSQSQD